MIKFRTANYGMCYIDKEKIVGVESFEQSLFKKVPRFQGSGEFIVRSNPEEVIAAIEGGDK